MPDVSFVFTNPRHHLEMMLPVARDLTRRGVSCQLVSLAELRGLDSPRGLDIPLRRVIPYNLRGSPSLGSSTAHSSGSPSRLRAGLRRLASSVLVPATARLVRGSRVAVIPNDWVFPYNGLLASLSERVRFIVMQEGIRLATPNGDAYGTGPLVALCAWGDGSAEFFRQRGVAPEIIRVTGAPRLDTLEPTEWRARGEALLARLGLRHAPIAYLSNPIEIQGYGTAAGRLQIFEKFLAEAEPWLRKRSSAVIVKNHQHEDAAEFRAVASRSTARDLVHVIPDVPLFEALSACSAAVVLTSTVGLEALMFGKPIAALEIPDHGFGFEYVESKTAIGLRAGSIAAGLSELIDGAEQRSEYGRQFLERHLHDRGRATAHVADVISQQLR